MFGAPCPPPHMVSPFATAKLSFEWIMPSQEEQLENERKWFRRHLVNKVVFSECHARMDKWNSDPVPINYVHPHKSRFVTKKQRYDGLFEVVGYLAVDRANKKRVVFSDDVDVAEFCADDPVGVFTCVEC